MTEVQSVLLELLKEIDSICKKNKISYYLTDVAGIFAVRSHAFEEGWEEASVMMTTENVFKFIDAVQAEGRKDRFIESMLNSPEYPYLNVRYGSKDTLDFAPEEWEYYTCPGIHVTIEIMRLPAISKRQEKMARIAEMGWCYHLPDRETDTDKYGRVFKLFRTLRKMPGGENVSAKVFNYLTHIKGRTSANCFIRREKKALVFPKNCFARTYYAELEGYTFPLPGLYSQVFTTMQGKKWIEREYNKHYDPLKRIVDTKIPYESYLAAMKKNGLDTAENHAAVLNATVAHKKLAPLRTRRNKAWTKMFFACDRYLLWEAYKPKMVSLRELYKENDVETMYEMFTDYDTIVKKYMRKGLGMCAEPELHYYYEYAISGMGRGEYANKVRNKIPEQIRKKIKLVDHTGKALKIKEEKGMRQATVDTVPGILAYCRRDIGNCFYMYVDISKYGLDNPNMQVWYDTDEKGINLVVMKYYNSISIYSDVETWDTKQVIDLIKKERVGMVSGQQWIIEKLYPSCEADYDIEIGYVYKLTNYREFENVVPIEKATVADTHDMAELICSNDSIGGYYEIENLASQLKERMETGMGRGLNIRDENGKLLATISTYAEYENLTVTAGLIAVDDGKKIPYGTLLESRLVLDLLDEGFEIFTFVTEKRRARFFKAMKCQEYGRYGKMTIKD